ncbi:hypothetical protein HDU97_000729 [Phlyctochytrium planicorne]|nr:hypothetical protein HDU97_000729 [Phlyctochytrium planicorne]
MGIIDRFSVELLLIILSYLPDADLARGESAAPSLLFNERNYKEIVRKSHGWSRPWWAASCHAEVEKGMDELERKVPASIASFLTGSESPSAALSSDVISSGVTIIGEEEEDDGQMTEFSLTDLEEEEEAEMATLVSPLMEPAVQALEEQSFGQPHSLSALAASFEEDSSSTVVTTIHSVNAIASSSNSAQVMAAARLADALKAIRDSSEVVDSAESPVVIPKLGQLPPVPLNTTRTIVTAASHRMNTVVVDNRFIWASQEKDDGWRFGLLDLEAENLEIAWVHWHREITSGRFVLLSNYDGSRWMATSRDHNAKEICFFDPRAVKKLYDEKIADGSMSKVYNPKALTTKDETKALWSFKWNIPETIRYSRIHIRDNRMLIVTGLLRRHMEYYSLPSEHVPPIATTQSSNESSDSDNAIASHPHIKLLWSVRVDMNETSVCLNEDVVAVVRYSADSEVSLHSTRDGTRYATIPIWRRGITNIQLTRTHLILFNETHLRMEGRTSCQFSHKLSVRDLGRSEFRETGQADGARTLKPPKVFQSASSSSGSSVSSSDSDRVGETTFSDVYPLRQVPDTLYSFLSQTRRRSYPPRKLYSVDISQTGLISQFDRCELVVSVDETAFVLLTKAMRSITIIEPLGSEIDDEKLVCQDARAEEKKNVKGKERAREVELEDKEERKNSTAVITRRTVPLDSFARISEVGMWVVFREVTDGGDKRGRLNPIWVVVDRPLIGDDGRMQSTATGGQH